MNRKLIRKLGITKIALLIAGVSVFFSVLFYLIISVIMGEPCFKGIIRAIVIPAIIAPILSYWVLRVLMKLDIAEEALQESEDRYRSIVENSHDGILIVDDGYHFVYVNEELCRILGYTSDEIIGQDFRKFLDEESKKIVSENYIRRQRGESPPSQYEFNIVRKNGEKRRVEIRSTVNKDSKGKTQTIAQILDITDTRKAEEELQKSEKRYRDVFENTGTATVIIEKEKKISMANTEFVKLSGYLKEEIEDKMSWTQFVLEKDLKTMERYHDERRQEKGEAPTEYEFRFIDKFGNTKQILNRVNMISGTDKSVASLLDITDITKAKSDLKVSEEKFRSITASAKDAIIMMNRDGTVSYWNEAAERMFGFSGKEILGKELHKVLSPLCVYSTYKAAFPEFQKTGNGPVVGKTLELTGLKRNGMEFPIELSVSALKLEGEWSAIGIVRDISKRKKLEEELRQAHKMEALGTLAGGIAHDFNNILGVIMGYAELAIYNASEKTKLENNLQGVLKGAGRAKELVKHILTFSRQSEQERKPIYIGPIVKEALKMLRASLPTTIEIHQQIEQNTGAVEADPTQVHQVMMNLCANASHAMSETGGILDIRLESAEIDTNPNIEYPEMGSGHCLKLTISDTGHGIKPKVMERIFEPYFTTKQRGEGTGLGLSVVHGIIKSHGGTIKVSSEPGNGATFEIFLPVIEEKPQQEIEAIESLPAGKEHVLFIDDEQDLIEIGEQMLTGLGYTVTTRTNSIEALELFKARPDRFDLVITDQTMPNITGKDLTEHLKSIRPDIAVIICTGFSEQIDEKRAKEMGISAFIMKPIVIHEMANTIRVVLDKK
jgi:PAS domain S-box-containing protein